MILATTNHNAVSSSSSITVSTNGINSGLITLPEMDVQSNTAEASPQRFGLRQADFQLRVEGLDADHWNAEKNARFKQLAQDEAFRELSIEEFAELESLTRLRRIERFPRSADEILWHRRQQKVTYDLVKALQVYVEFHEPPHLT
jgi:hypothetical protein